MSPSPHLQREPARKVDIGTDAGWRAAIDRCLFTTGAQGPLPVVLIRLPYKNRYVKVREPGSDAHFFAGHGYHVVVQDMRGRYES